MIKNCLSAVLLFASVIVCSGQQDNTWDQWNWLIGKWQGEGSGQPGTGSGTFSFEFSLDNNILVRKSHSEYPAAENKPEIIHDDLMIIYQDMNTGLFRAVYFDNESHTIFYTATFNEKSITLTSDKIPGNPVFRLIYSLLDNDTVFTQFEISQDGQVFMPYIDGKSIRINSNP
jgi:hypothetical protein